MLIMMVVTVVTARTTQEKTTAIGRDGHDVDIAGQQDVNDSQEDDDNEDDRDHDDEDEVADDEDPKKPAELSPKTTLMNRCGTRLAHGVAPVAVPTKLQHNGILLEAKVSS